MTDLLSKPLVEVDWLAARLQQPQIRIVDCRWQGGRHTKAAYAASHIPGAVHIDWRHDLCHRRHGIPDMLLPPPQFARVMGQHGISNDHTVIAYAEKDVSGATRLWWALRYYGHTQVAVLNGGLDRWKAQKRPLSTEIPQPAPAQFTPVPQPDWLATAKDVEQALHDPALQLVDTRPPEQYAGRAVWTAQGSRYLPPGEEWVEANGRLQRAGHIPGAIHLHATSNQDSYGWRYLPVSSLRQRFIDAGLRPEHKIIAYCGVGISASNGLFALYLAGFRKLALYDASWVEWGADANRPISRSK